MENSPRRQSGPDTSSGPRAQAFSTLSSDDTCTLQSTSGIYAAIFEFSQASYPKTIWEYGSLVLNNNDGFKLYVVNTPVNSCSSDFNTEPSIVVSSYEGISYIAVYTQLYDAEARGFTRTIIFTIAMLNFDTITKLHSKYYNKIIEIIKIIQSPSVEKFPLELKQFARSLSRIQEQENNKNQIINSKMEELQRILKLFKIEKYDDVEYIERPLEYFTIINNALRPIEELIHLEDIRPKLEEFVDSLPYNSFLANIDTESSFVESPITIDFGGSSNFRGFGGFPAFALRSMHLQACPYSLVKFSKNNVFFFIGFTLLSGQTLIIRSNDISIAKPLAERLIFLVPFFRPEYYKICKTITPEESLKYSIVVTENICGDAKHLASVLDLQSDYYAGDGCPPSSIVWKVLGKSTNVSETAFILHMLMKLKDCAACFVMKLAEVSGVKALTPDSLLNDLRAFGFSKDDAPILKYWIASYFNKDKLKPILRGNRSKSGLTMAPF